jgi:hypothetical protein
MRVYHFLDATYAVANISLRRLKISRFNTLNDPFELLAADLLDPRHRVAFKNFKNELNECSGMISFSKTWGNPLLWGHYAKCHTGMALGFDVPDEFLTPVIYTHQRAKIQFDKKAKEVVDGKSVVDKLLRTKFADWAYEEEYRMHINLEEATKEGEHYFSDFSEDLVLREVITGLNCDLPPQRVAQLLKGDLSKVTVKKAGLALRSFKIIEDRSARLDVNLRA